MPWESLMRLRIADALVLVATMSAEHMPAGGHVRTMAQSAISKVPHAKGESSFNGTGGSTVGAHPVQQELTRRQGWSDELWELCESYGRALRCRHGEMGPSPLFPLRGVLPGVSAGGNTCELVRDDLTASSGDGTTKRV